MRPWVAQFLAFLLGIALTVAVYETRRLYVNASLTVQAAQLRLEQRAEREKRRASRAERRAEQRGGDPSERAARRAEDEVEGRLGPIREELREAIGRVRSGEAERREVLEGLSPEAKEALAWALSRRARTVRGRKRWIEERGGPSDPFSARLAEELPLDELLEPEGELEEDRW